MAEGKCNVHICGKQSPTLDFRCQLHMIENRARIENQILLGRKSTRKSLQQPPKVARNPAQELQSMLPENASTGPPPTGSDNPLSVDTDAEAAFANGARSYFRRAHTSSPSGTSTPNNGNEPSQDALRSPGVRRRWATDHLHPTSNGEAPRRAEKQSAHQPKQTGAGRSSASFLTRLRTKSFPNLAYPLNTQHNGASKESVMDVTAEQGWSSDSSFDDEISLDNPRHNLHTSFADFEPVIDGGDGFGFEED